MKKIKKILAFVCAMVLTLAMGTTAFATDAPKTYKITINNTEEGHTYQAYQIFSGTLGADGELGNIAWGNGVNSTDLGNAADKVAALTAKSDAENYLSAADFAKEVGTKLTTVAGTTNTCTDGKYEITGLAAGYYLVKDQAGSLSATNKVGTDFILKVVKDTEASPKTSTTTVVKKVQDINDTEDNNIGDNTWQDSADHDINDHVPFQLTATLANNVSSYDTYKVVFHDTLSEGLTFDGNDTVTVKMGNQDVKSFFDITSTTKAETGETTLTLTCNDVKQTGFAATDGSVITVEYTATLNDKANIGSSGNPNKVYLEYSNNPTNSGSGENNETGKTPEDKVIVFTYKTVINKVDQDKASLAGAAFKLEKKDKDGNYNLVKEFTVDSKNPATSFEFKGLDDGTYKLTETVTPAGYNTIAPVEFTIGATHSETADNPELLTLTGTAKDGAIELTVDKTTGSLSSDVINNKGAQLPETGGIGTTIFYVAGAVMMIGAGVILVTRKRVRQ